MNAHVNQMKYPIFEILSEMEENIDAIIMADRGYEYNNVSSTKKPTDILIL